MASGQRGADESFEALPLIFDILLLAQPVAARRHTIQ
jgi:hypothetical protein